jgi:ATP-dependent DNA helicase PIF1
VVLKLLHQASLIIWEEASITKRQDVEALDNSLYDIMGKEDILFGGKTVCLCWGFQRHPPVVRNGSKD